MKKQKTQSLMLSTQLISTLATVVTGFLSFLSFTGRTFMVNIPSVEGLVLGEGGVVYSKLNLGLLSIILFPILFGVTILLWKWKK